MFVSEIQWASLRDFDQFLIEVVLFALALVLVMIVVVVVVVLVMISGIGMLFRMIVEILSHQLNIIAQLSQNHHQIQIQII